MIKQSSQFYEVTQPECAQRALWECLSSSVLELGSGPGFLALPDQPSLVLSGNYFSLLFVTTLRQALPTLFGRGAAAVSEAGGAGWILVGREFAHTLDTQVLLCVPQGLQSRIANPFVHLLLAQEL